MIFFNFDGGSSNFWYSLASPCFLRMSPQLIYGGAKYLISSPQWLAKIEYQLGLEKRRKQTIVHFMI
jgi:hypothetical protein